MGIRFYCPNGHRLNVKDFLAGKRGICPHCEVRFRIPPESEIPKGSPRVKPGSTAALGSAPERGIPVAPRRRSNSSILQTATIDKPLVSVQVRSNEEVHSNEHDPIEEAPDSVWYVRPPAGGQYGPAKGEVVRRWIAEGRVSADSLVWREGWSDWKLAGPIFPSLVGLNAMPTRESLRGDQGEIASEADLDVIVEMPSEVSAPSQALPTPTKKAKSQKGPKGYKSAAAVIGLVMLIIVLAIGLVTVLAFKS
jgi:hypothetical protein